MHERAAIRLKCLELAVHLRTGQSTPAGVIAQAREFEAYAAEATGEPDKGPAPAAPTQKRAGPSGAAKP